MTDPYRTPEAPKVRKPEYIPIFEERVISFRNKLPGPLRRFLAVLTIVPAVTLSFVLCVLLLPFVWILKGECKFMLDADRGNYGPISPMPFLRGTWALYFKYPRITRLRTYRGVYDEGLNHYADS